jgi:hypothetical protein
MNSARREELRGGLAAVSTMFLLLVLINFTIYVLTLDLMLTLLLALISVTYFAGLVFTTIRPHRRWAALQEVAVSQDERDIAEIATLDRLAEDIDNVLEFPSGRDAVRAPDRPVPLP